jgi:hypothetical protein
MKERGALVVAWMLPALDHISAGLIGRQYSQMVFKTRIAFWLLLSLFGFGAVVISVFVAQIVLAILVGMWNLSPGLLLFFIGLPTTIILLAKFVKGNVDE